MRIEVEQVVGEEVAREACEFTFNGTSKIDMGKLARCEHSPLRTQMFIVRMYDIPSFVSVHLVRHKHGVEHYVLSKREDNCGVDNVLTNRLSPVNHMMFINAQALINMSRKRLCMKASKETRQVMYKIRSGCPKWLQKYMVSECEYRNFVCPELKPCKERAKHLPDIRCKTFKIGNGMTGSEMYETSLDVILERITGK